MENKTDVRVCEDREQGEEKKKTGSDREAKKGNMIHQEIECNQRKNNVTYNHISIKK